MMINSSVTSSVSFSHDHCFETLSSKLRIEVIRLLSQNAMSVSEISQKLGVEQSRLSHSLQLLRDCNYVDVIQKGKQRIYSLKDNVFKGKEGNIFEVIDGHIQEFCNNKCTKIEAKVTK